MNQNQTPSISDEDLLLDMEESVEADGTSLLASEAEGEHELPAYVYSDNQSMRESMYKEFGIQNESSLIFNKLCEYATKGSRKNPIIKIDDFIGHLSGNVNLKGIQRRNILSPLFRLISMVEKEGLNFIKALEVDDIGEPSVILLKEKVSNQDRIYRVISDYFAVTYKRFIEQTEIPPSREKVLGKLSITSNQLNNIVNEVDTHQITFAKIAEAASSKRPLTVFVGNDFISDTIFLTKRVPLLVKIFIRKLWSYYEDNLNDDFRTHIVKKIREQKIDQQKLSRVVRHGLVEDAYFLFFSQLFYNMMTSIQDKMQQQNVQNIEVQSYCFISFFLSQLSINERQIALEKKRAENMTNEHYHGVVRGLLEYYVVKGKQKIYPPAKLFDILRFPVKPKVAGQTSEVTFGNFYGEKELSQLIQKKNKSNETIPDVLKFVSSGVDYYIHRARLILSFSTAVATERESVKAAIFQDWSNDERKILKRGHHDKFNDLINSYYASVFLKNFLLLVMQIFNAHTASDNSLDAGYLQKRLFLSEQEKLTISPTTEDLVFRNDGGGKKKTILKNFYEFVFDLTTATIREPHELLNISFNTMRHEAMSNLEGGLLRRVLVRVKDMWISFFRLFRADKVRDILIERSKKFAATIGEGNSSQKKSFNTPKNSPGSSIRPRSSRDSNKEEVRKVLLKNLPELKQARLINKLIEEQHDLWNIRIGDARSEVRSLVDQRVAQMAERFDANGLSVDNMDFFYDKIVGQYIDELKPIGSVEALKLYIFYKSAFILYQQTKK